MITRRAALLSGAASVMGVAATGLVSVEERWAPGRDFVNQHLGLEGADGSIPQATSGAMTSAAFMSADRAGRSVGYTIAWPTAVRQSLPIVVVLHGKGGNHSSTFGDQLGLDKFLASGKHDFAVASVDGGDGYWHHRADGDDPGSMVINEFLPRLKGHGLNTDRIGFLGWSMGGFGSLYLAGRLGAARVAAVSVESPALWRQPGRTVPGAFDGPADFTTTDVFTHTAALAGIPVRIDCGTDDPFYPAARDYAALLRPNVVATFPPGAHTMGFWRRMAPAQLDFLGRHLAT